MEELMQKYAQVLLKTCLKIEKGQCLLINFNAERIDFARIVAKEAYKLGVKDIYFDMKDAYLKHDALLALDTKDLKKTQMWDRTIWNEYAKKGAAFLNLTSENPGLMKDVDPKKMNEMSMYSLKTCVTFDELRDKVMFPWCIAAVPTETWAKELFPKAENPVKELWMKIFAICGINFPDTEGLWESKIEHLISRAQKLNTYQFKKLKYKNSLGTDLEISLPKNHIWASGKETLQNGKDVIVNFPTEEIFTSPDATSANGIVYASLPLCYQNVVIKDFSITFKEGVAVSCEAKEGEETLKQLIHSTENANRLGEIALVPYDSPIREADMIFYETLYDENAACHMALGASFTECIQDGPNKTKEELATLHLNQCENHVDFMIGTKDLEIIGITEDNKEIPIFEEGNFSKLFE